MSYNIIIKCCHYKSSLRCSLVKNLAWTVHTTLYHKQNVIYFQELLLTNFSPHN